MTSPHRFKVPDTESLSDLRAGGRLLGVRLVRELVRSGTKTLLLERIRDGVRELLDEIAIVARDDDGSDEARCKAAEFIIHLRARREAERSLGATINAVAETAARTRYRSARIVDFLSFWLFVLGEQFIAGISDPATIVELESEHSALWNRFRAEMLEVLEAGTERQRAGRRFRLAEGYLARFRLVRARFDEQLRVEADRLAGTGAENARDRTPDYVSSMAIDLFALTLTDLQQRLVISQIPAASSTRGRNGFSDEDVRRLWAPLRAVRPDQAFVRWPRMVNESNLGERQAIQELCRGMGLHLQRAWEWFFPERRPYGTVRGALRELETTMQEGRVGADTARAALHHYAETLSFILRLATEDSESVSISFDLEDPSGGTF